ncbi:hypothetical protein EV213_101306 [Aureibacillus halotolerans]|uniref:Uncharacterized protein n=1 Tax=Aureibacillus halotolerans TaxID=1508390 RepID=A0A4R6UAJ4_9BACI|nr:hypothetical protein EV213_101306 [Aureibacillus halotolerans]
MVDIIKLVGALLFLITFLRICFFGLEKHWEFQEMNPLENADALKIKRKKSEEVTSVYHVPYPSLFSKEAKQIDFFRQVHLIRATPMLRQLNISMAPSNCLFVHEEHQPA